MYFIPRNNRFYSLLISLKSAHLYAATGALMCVLVLLWWQAFYVPATKQLAILREEKRYLLHQQKLLDKTTKEINFISHDVKRLVAAYAGLAGNITARTALSSLLATALESGVTVVSCVCAAQQKNSWYVLHPIEIVCTGSFEHMMHFFNHLADAHVIIVDRMCLTRKVDLSIEMSGTFCYVEVQQYETKNTISEHVPDSAVCPENA